MLQFHQSQIEGFYELERALFPRRCFSYASEVFNFIDYSSVELREFFIGWIDEETSRLQEKGILKTSCVVSHILLCIKFGADFKNDEMLPFRHDKIANSEKNHIDIYQRYADCAKNCPANIVDGLDENRGLSTTKILSLVDDFLFGHNDWLSKTEAIPENNYSCYIEKTVNEIKYSDRKMIGKKILLGKSFQTDPLSPIKIELSLRSIQGEKNEFLHADELLRSALADCDSNNILYHDELL